MENLIRVVNELQDAATQVSSTLGQSGGLSIQLPQIAVVGSQSSGKSSVLESFVGKSFLPRGSGIVTRRPLVLQLLNAATEYGEFLHLPGKKFTNFDDICVEIQRETDRVTGSNKGISPIPINLRVYSPTVLDLTLVDLPGLTKVPVGDQPPDIEVRIREMIMTHIESENCLILAVTPANGDLANSDALQMAREVDPKGDRTIGVLTKLDLMDEGTNAMEALGNKIYPLKYGYIGVVNRSQRDIDQKKGIDAAIEAERRFFLQHPIYRKMVDTLGSQYLQKMLNLHLTRHIGENLPGLKAKLLQQANLIREQLKGFTMEFNYDDPSWKLQASVVKTIEFSKQFRMELIGNSEDLTNFEKLSVGAEIRHLFHVKYPLALAGIKFTDEQTLKKKIGFAILNVVGVRAGIFTPDKAFDYVIREQIRQMREPTQYILEAVVEKVFACLKVSLECLSMFPYLQQELESLTRCAVMEIEAASRNQVNMLVEFELAYINAKHEDFVGFSFVDQSPDTVRNYRKNPTREVVHQGRLSMGGGWGLDRGYWFVLTCESLSWYRDQSLNDRQYSIPIDGRLRTQFSEKNPRSFYLFGDEKRNIYKTMQKLELVAKTQEEMEEWIVNFVNVGIYLFDPNEADASRDASLPEDPHLKWQVETIYIIVDSYLRIVRQNLQDLVPKAIVHSVIMKVTEYLEQKIVTEICRRDANQLMQEDAGAVEQRQKLQKHLSACERALKILGNLDISKPLVDPNFKESHVPALPAKPRRAPSPSGSIRRPPSPSRRRAPSPGPKPSVPSRPPPPVPFDRKFSDSNLVRRGANHNSSWKLKNKNQETKAGSIFYVPPS